MEVEEDGVGYSSLVVGNNHAGPSGHAWGMMHMYIPS